MAVLSFDEPVTSLYELLKCKLKSVEIPGSKVQIIKDQPAAAVQDGRVIKAAELPLLGYMPPVKGAVPPKE